MAIKRYTADADNTIVNAYKPNLTTRGTGSNMGAADVMEIYSIYGRQSTSSAELSRALVKFPVSDISSDRTAGTIPASGSVKFYLRLFNAPHSRAVPESYKLVVNLVSQSWQEGSGLDLEGYKDVTLGNVGSNWMSASNTAVWKDISNALKAGGSYITGSGNIAKIVNTEIFTFEQTFTTGLENMELNITPMVEQWIAGTYSNYGVGIRLSSSYEASSSVSTYNPADADTIGVSDDTGVLMNVSGATTSYYTKRFFARNSQFFFKRPVLEARWDDSKRDDRGDFFRSSSLAPAGDNLNTLYMYNYVRGRLTDIPGLGAQKRVYVSIFSGTLENDGPTTGSGVQQLDVDNVGHVTSTNRYVVTGGIVSTGIYSASFAMTGAISLTPMYDVWFTGSHQTKNADDWTATQYFTGTIKPLSLDASEIKTRPTYYMNITNLKDRYRQDEQARFNLYVREKNWNPTIYTKANATAPATSIHSASYRVYRIIDAYDAVPYGTGSDNHTMLSYDVSGNYFDFNMNLLESGYEYAFKFAFYESDLDSWREQPYVFRFRVEDYEY
tara:strand:+ start:11906 stop:13570 length:1665 start_codon:yes stop_codon:yes gene_type:complete